MKYIVTFLAVIVSVSSGEMIMGQLTTESNIWKMNYTIDTTRSMFYATVYCKSTGWIGMGLSYDAPSGHAKTDSMVAFSVNGTHHIYDQYSAAGTQPQLDTALGGKNDLTITGWSKSNGANSVTFMRPLNTNDGNRDVVIENKDVYVAWACGNDVPQIKSDGSISYKIHPSGQFGGTQTNLFNSAVAPTTSPAQSGSSGSSGSGGSTAPQTPASAAASASSWIAYAVAALLALAAYFLILFSTYGP